jgi:hypothetical protein
VRWKVALFLLTVGLAASVPVLASPVLAGHYFLPSVPVFALAVAAAALPAVQAYRDLSLTPRRYIPVGLAITLVVLSVAVLLANGPMERRDAGLIAGLRGIGSSLTPDTTIGTCAGAAEEWGLHGYTQRFFRVSLAAADRPRAGWFLVRREGCQPPSGCVQDITASELTLFRCASADR